MNKNYLLPILVLVIFGGVIVLGFYYFSLTKRSSPVTVGPGGEVANPTIPLTNGKILATPTVHIEKIPFDYEVVSVSADKANLTAEKGEATLPNSPNVKVFKGAPPEATPSDFSALAVGQKLRVERTISGKVQEVKVYIVE